MVLTVTLVPGDFLVNGASGDQALCSTNAATATWTLDPAAPTGTQVEWVQGAGGQIVFQPGPGAALTTPLMGHNASACQYAQGCLLVLSNLSGSNAAWNLAGYTTSSP